MRHLKSAAFRAALLVSLSALAFALDTTELHPTGYVNDFAHALDASNAHALELYCASLERETGVQMAIVTVETLDGEPVEDVTNRLFHEWGVGKKGKDEGIMLLLAIKDHKQRAEIGYGLEPIVSDADAGAILRGIRPILRQGNYGGALLAATQQFGSQIAQAKGVPLNPARPVGRVAPQAETRPGSFFGIVIGIIIFIIIIRFISRLGGGWGGGGSGGSGAGGFLAGMILGNLMGGRRGGGWGGGGFGGYDGGGGGGGFGGFGGGDSGGGGASSGW